MIRWIKSHEEYIEFTKAERAVRTTYFYAPLLDSKEGFAMGITISKKISNSVLRNKLKRRVKAWIRENRSILPNGTKMNLIARRGVAQLSWDDLSEQLTQLMGMV